MKTILTPNDVICVTFNVLLDIIIVSFAADITLVVEAESFNIDNIENINSKI